MATSYEIDYNDKQFKNVESDKKAALKENAKLYDGMISESDKFYEEQIKASKDWADTQTKLQNEQTDFAIEKIEQEKEQAKTDYTKEQSGAYQDWKKQSAKHGVNAEQIADQGMQNTGYSESSQVSMWNTYQNRVATAREAYGRIIQDFNNGITEARLQNNSALAEIRYNALQQQLELNLQGFQYKNQLLLDKAGKQTELEQMYYERWKDVLDQMNTENSLAEQIRQFNKSYELQKKSFTKASKGCGYSGGGGGSSGRSAYIEKPGSPSTNNSSSGALPSDTRDSILALGQGPISGGNLGNQVKSGSVTVSTSPSTGNPIYSKAPSNPTSGLLYRSYK